VKQLNRFVLSTQQINDKLSTMKKTNIIFWITTGIIFLMEGLMPALTSQTELAKEGIRHLGYPPYFGVLLTVFKVVGALVLIIPKFPPRVKEWAYAGFTFDFIFASVSTAATDGIGGAAFFPLIFLVILFISYRAYHKKLDAGSTNQEKSNAYNSKADMAGSRFQ
jgi:uncharacterized membrane protein YphA (DoxX/SURF4 family)